MIECYFPLVNPCRLLMIFLPFMCLEVFPTIGCSITSDCYLTLKCVLKVVTVGSLDSIIHQEMEIFVSYVYYKLLQITTSEANGDLK